jgi:hypothetical protein
MGNGAKAQQKRERNAKDANKGPTSQLKSVRLPSTPLVGKVECVHRNGLDCIS